MHHKPSQQFLEQFSPEMLCKTVSQIKANVFNEKLKPTNAIARNEFNKEMDKLIGLVEKLIRSYELNKEAFRDDQEFINHLKKLVNNRALLEKQFTSSRKSLLDNVLDTLNNFFDFVTGNYSLDKRDIETNYTLPAPPESASHLLAPDPNGSKNSPQLTLHELLYVVYALGSGSNNTYEKWLKDIEGAITDIRQFIAPENNHTRELEGNSVLQNIQGCVPTSTSQMTPNYVNTRLTINLEGG